MKRDKSKKRRRVEEDEPKRKGRGSQMDEFRELWEEEDDSGEKDERFEKLEEGKNVLRVMPNKDPDDPFFVSYAMHFNMGPDGDEKFRCIEPGGPFGHSKKKDKARNYKAKKCPACKMYCRGKTKSRAFKFGSKEGKAYWRENVAPWRAKHRFIFATNRPKSKQWRRKVRVLDQGVMIGQPLIQAFYDENMGGDFTNPKTGRNIVITKTKLGSEANEVEYKTVIVPDRTPLKLWKKLKGKLPDLNTYVPEALDPDAIIAIIEGNGDLEDESWMKDKGSKKSKKKRRDDDGDDDEDLDDVDDDDDEDEGSSRREKLGKRRRGSDEDVDPDADEEDDDDDEDEKKEKKKKKKSKMRDKLKKKARRDDDDDDDDDEEDDSDDDEDEDEEDSDDDGDEDDDEDDDDDEPKKKKRRR